MHWHSAWINRVEYRNRFRSKFLHLSQLPLSLAFWISTRFFTFKSQESNHYKNTDMKRSKSPTTYWFASILHSLLIWNGIGLQTKHQARPRLRFWNLENRKTNLRNRRQTHSMSLHRKQNHQSFLFYILKKMKGLSMNIKKQINRKCHISTFWKDVEKFVVRPRKIDIP